LGRGGRPIITSLSLSLSLSLAAGLRARGEQRGDRAGMEQPGPGVRGADATSEPAIHRVGLGSLLAGVDRHPGDDHPPAADRALRCAAGQAPRPGSRHTHPHDPAPGHHRQQELRPRVQAPPGGDRDASDAQARQLLLEQHLPLRQDRPRERLTFRASPTPYPREPSSRPSPPEPPSPPQPTPTNPNPPHPDHPPRPDARLKGSRADSYRDASASNCKLLLPRRRRDYTFFFLLFLFFIFPFFSLSLFIFFSLLSEQPFSAPRYSIYLLFAVIGFTLSEFYSSDSGLDFYIRLRHAWIYRATTP
jgi:hypothetical protein